MVHGPTQFTGKILFILFTIIEKISIFLMFGIAPIAVVKVIFSHSYFLLVLINVITALAILLMF